MSAKRWSWFAVAVLVLLMALLVVRTLQRDAPARDTGADVATEARPTAPRDAEAPRAGADTTRGRAKQGERVPSSVERAKLVLKQRGYYDGPIDGSYDPTMAKALAAFQKDAGMKPTGYLDPKTYEALGIRLLNRRERAGQ